MGVQLLQDGLDIAASGVDADTHSLGDRRKLIRSGHEAEDLTLARGQSGDLAFPFAAIAGSGAPMLQQAGELIGREEDLAGGRAPDR